MKGTKREKKLAQTLIVMLCSVYARCFVYLRNVFTNHKNWHPHINCKICTVFCTDAFTYVCTHYAQRANVSNSIITQPNCVSNKKVHCQMKQVRKMHEYHHHHHPSIVLCNHEILVVERAVKNDTGSIYRFNDGHMIKKLHFFRTQINKRSSIHLVCNLHFFYRMEHAGFH